jgi:7-keto-8-aminopelargonate synthetase-like enzyme
MTLEKQYMFDGAPGAIVKIDGVEFSYFGGTSYYELSKNNEVINSASDALKNFGITSSSSRSSYGTTHLLLDLEKAAADFFTTEDSVYLPSGFLTDMAAIQVFNKKNFFDVIFIDEFSHYSNHYASLLSCKPIFKFAHNNFNDLEDKISKHLSKNQKPLIISDGVFPLNGEIAPVDKYHEITEKENGILWIDDAHGIGILGGNGRGTYEHFSLNSARIYFGGTLSKAFGGFGGIIPGKKEFIDAIKNSELINGTTPAPASAIAASMIGIKLLQSNPEWRIKLIQNTKYLKGELAKIGIPIDDNPVPIIAFKLDGKKNMLRIKDELKNNNILIQFINYTGSGIDGMIRIVVFSSHTIEQIDNLIFHLKKII